MDRTIPILGRPMKIGNLYDSGTEKLLAVALADESQLNKNVSRLNEQLFEVKLIYGESLDEKLNLLGIDDETKLAILTGKLRLPSALSWILEPSESVLKSRFLLRYQLIERTESLAWEKILAESVINQQMLNKSQFNGTHVVSSVTFGYQSFAIIDLTSSTAKEIKQRAEELLCLLSDLADCNRIPFPDECSNLQKITRCTLYGNPRPAKMPKNLLEIIEYCSQLEIQMKACTEDPVPLFAQLSSLGGMNQPTSINNEITGVTRSDTLTIVRITDELNFSRNAVADLMASSATHVFDWIRAELRSVIKLTKDYQAALINQLVNLATAIQNAADEEEFQYACAVHERSPFGNKSLAGYLKAKTKELLILDSVAKALSSFGFCQNQTDIDCMINDLSFKRVVSLEFNLVILSDPYLRLFKAGKSVGCSPVLWCEHVDTVRLMKSTIQTFIEFFEVNQTERRLGFMVAFLENAGDSFAPCSTKLYENASPTLYRIPSTPEGLQISNVSSSSIGVQITAIDDDDSSQTDTWIIVQYRPVNDTVKWTEVKLANSQYIVISNLLASTLHEFRLCKGCSLGLTKWSAYVRASTLPEPATLQTETISATCDKISSAKHSEGFHKQSGEDSVHAPVEPWFDPVPRCIEHLMSDAIFVEDGSPSLYKLNLKITAFDEKGMFRRLPVDGYTASADEKIVLLMGDSEADKNRLVDLIFNWFFGVRFEDSVRFQVALEDEAAPGNTTVCKWINMYTAQRMLDSPSPYSITIIDCPVAGNFEDIQQLQLINQLQELFTNEFPIGTSRIDALCIVSQASAVREHSILAQQYRIESFLSLFGNDLANNTFLFFTSADDDEPMLLKTIKAESIPYFEAFVFNSVGLYASNENAGQFRKSMWQLTFASVSSFMTSLGYVKPKDVTLTLEVLKERSLVETTSDSLQSLLNIAHQEQNEPSSSIIGASSENSDDNVERIEPEEDESVNPVEHSEEISEDLTSLFLVLSSSLKRLEQIALNPTVKSAFQYFDWLIVSDQVEFEKKFDRLKALRKAKDNALLIKKAREASPLLNDHF